MRKITVQLTMRLVMAVNEGIEISEVVGALDCQITDTTTRADILDVEVTDYEITYRK